MDKKPIVLVAVMLSLVACILSGVALFSGPTSPAVSAALPNSNSIQLNDLAAQISEIRAELDRERQSREADHGTTRVSEDSPRRLSEDPEVLKRLEALESSYAALRRQLKQVNDVSSASTAEKPDLRDMQGVVTNRRASEKQKLEAMKALRNQKIDGQDALSRDVILPLIDIAEHSQDEESRLDVYRNLHGVNESALRDSMLRALANDPSAKVRQKVAQDIDTFLPDAQVEAALKQAADNDADSGVRGQALMTLARKH
jgi:HEAT repeats